MASFFLKQPEILIALFNLVSSNTQKESSMQSGTYITCPQCNEKNDLAGKLASALILGQSKHPTYGADILLGGKNRTG